MEDIVYEKNFGNDTFGKVVFENGNYQCYETPLFGGDYQKVGNPFYDIDDAINYLNSLT
jgi:hypothetical protein